MPRKRTKRPIKRKEPKRWTVFLDRDGVINVDRIDYVKSWSEFKFLPGVFEALRLLNRHNLRVIIVTNQSAVNRALMSVDMLEEIHQKMHAGIRKHGGRIEAIYYCPHTPSENCNCRKPKPGMVLKAVKDLDINLARSYLVGDSNKDVELAQSLGIKSIRVIGKNKPNVSPKHLRWAVHQPILVKNLRRAVEYILLDIRRSSRR